MGVNKILKPTLCRVRTTNGGDAVVLVHWWEGPSYALQAEALTNEGEPCGRMHWVPAPRIKDVSLVDEAQERGHAALCIVCFKRRTWNLSLTCYACEARRARKTP
jgi:hypothetical protein